MNDELPDEIVRKILERTGAWRTKAGGRWITAASVCRLWRRIWRSSSEAVVGSYVDVCNAVAKKIYTRPTALALFKIARGPHGASGDRTWDASKIQAMMRRCVDDAFGTDGDGKGGSKDPKHSWFDSAISLSAGEPVALGRLIDAFPERKYVKQVKAETLKDAFECVLGASDVTEEQQIDFGIRKLLKWPVRSRRPRADWIPAEEEMMDGCTSFLCGAACNGLATVVKFLLSYPRHPARADQEACQALMDAATNGHADVVRVLLDWPLHAPRADVHDCAVVLQSLENKDDAVARILLRHRTAPSAARVIERIFYEHADGQRCPDWQHCRDLIRIVVSIDSKESVGVDSKESVGVDSKESVGVADRIVKVRQEAHDRQEEKDADRG